MAYLRENYSFVLRYLSRCYGHDVAYDTIRQHTISSVDLKFIEDNIIPIKDVKKHKVKTNDVSRKIIEDLFHNKSLSQNDNKLVNSICKMRNDIKKEGKIVELSINEVVSNQSNTVNKNAKNVKIQKCQCKAIKMDGKRCTALVTNTQQLCGKHMRKCNKVA
tara:strand:- start:332 stop:817 length:486 start_codon:yes stop_codon:yes gene_type:complete